jgi:membrane protease YdiL (CAAX protease family)
MTTWQTRFDKVLGPALLVKVPRDHQEPDSAFRRRRVVVAVVLVLGATLLGFSLAAKPGDRAFYLLSAGLAATWSIGGFFSGPLHLGQMPYRGSLRRPIVTPILLGVVASGIFVLGALVVREIPPLRDYIENILAHARQGSLLLVFLITVVNGIGEEIFFRGALFAAIGRKHPVLISTGIYTVVTLASGNPMLAFAAVTLGFVWGLQRRASGGILGSILTHVTWSTIMLFALPPLFAAKP